jgi:signal transduction histidine kinase
MKTLTTNRLTLAYLQKLDHSNVIATFSAIIFITFSFLWMLFHVGGDEGTSMMSNIAYMLAALFGASLTLLTAYRTRFGPVPLDTAYGRAWLYTSLGMISLLIGGIYFSYLQLNGHSPFPSLADLFFNVSYPLMFIGLLSLPTTMPIKFRTVIDVLITTLCFFGIIWFFDIGPLYFTLLNQSSSFPTIVKLIIGLSYPCWDIVLILAASSLIQRHVEPALHLSILLIGVGIITNTWGDTTYAYTTILTTIYQTGTPWIDPFWLISMVLIGLASTYQYAALTRKALDEQALATRTTQLPLVLLRTLSLPLRGWHYLQSSLVYIPLVLLLALAIFGELTQDSQVESGLILITALTGTLIATRHFLTTHENDALVREREQQQQEAERLRSMVTQLTGIFEMDHLRRQAVLLAKMELGFDAAILLFMEGENLPLDPSPLISVVATSKDTNVESWHLHGDNILYRTFLKKKVVTLRWSEHSSDIPEDIRAWLQQQHITTTHFFPLAYQGRQTGYLGVAQRSDLPLHQRDYSILETYTGQVATLIDHARLYQEAREHEEFSKALANIATRLNEAVPEPVEIGQLICETGARALRADYTVLYIKDPKNELQLVPLCAHIQPDGGLNAVDDSGPLITPVTDARQWPPISMQDYEGQALHTPQPTLLYVSQPLATPQIRPLLANGTEPRRNSGILLARDTYNARISSLREMLTMHFARTAILAPLTTRGEPVGILIFARSQMPGSGEKRALDMFDLPHAQDFSEQAGVAFTNAQLYQSLSQTHERLKELDQMKDQFMVTASHELRTPLTAVQGYIELMAEYDDELPPEQRREFLQKARRGCDELAVLLGNVMDASRLEGEMSIRPALLKRVSVEEMIDSVIILIEPHLTKEQRTLHKLIPPHLAVLADPVRLRQVLMNISTNALKYSPHGTPIGFSARAVGPCVIISVADKGKGVPPELQSHIFQRFYRAESDVNSPVRGSGLGLYIAHRLLLAMGGKIWIESQGIPGEGSIFHIQLPMAL